jgi:hypothetical protein
MIKNRVSVLVAVLTAVVFGSVGTTGAMSEPPGIDELVKVKGKHEFKKTRIRPETDFSRYTKLRAETVALTVQDPGKYEEPTGSLVGQGSGGGIMPAYEDLTKLKQILNEAIVAGLDANAEFELTDTAEPGTLLVRASVKEALCDETLRIKTAAGEPSPVLEEATIVFDLIDAETGVIVARFEERRKNKKPKGASVSDAAGPWPWAAMWAETAAGDLCRELERIGSDVS